MALSLIQKAISKAHTKTNNTATQNTLITSNLGSQTEKDTVTTKITGQIKIASGRVNYLANKKQSF